MMLNPQQREKSWLKKIFKNIINIDLKRNKQKLIPLKGTVKPPFKDYLLAFSKLGAYILIC